MKHKSYSDLQVEAMIKIRFGKLVNDEDHPSFTTYENLGHLFKCSASKVRQLIQARFERNQRLNSSLLEQMQL